MGVYSLILLYLRNLVGHHVSRYFLDDTGSSDCLPSNPDDVLSSEVQSKIRVITVYEESRTDNGHNMFVTVFCYCFSTDPFDLVHCSVSDLC